VWVEGRWAGASGSVWRPAVCRSGRGCVAAALGAGLTAVLAVLAVVGRAVRVPVLDRLAPGVAPILANSAACCLLVAARL
jgi:hypothetical protein